MTGTLEDLKIAAALLPDADRAELADFLLGSFSDKMNPQLRSEWLAVARSRMAEIKSGNVVGIPADTLLQELHGSLR